jgi:hypothetical protein
VYRLVEIHATKLRLNEIASSAGKVVLQLCATFQTADKAKTDRTWMTSALAISPRLSYCYDDVNLEEIDNQMLSLGGKAYDKHMLQHVAHCALSQFTFTHLYHHLLEGFALYGSIR